MDLIARSVLQSAWQGTIVALLAAATLFAWPRSTARLRYAILYSSLALMGCAFLASAAAPPPAPLHFSTVIATCWLAGLVLLSLRLAGGWWVLRRSRNDPPASAWEPTVARVSARLGMVRSVKVIESAWAETSGLVGWRQPAILLPVRTLASASAEHVEAIVAHELAHVCRRDYVMNLLQTALEALLFFHPAAWWLSRRACIEREYCCDDVAAALYDDPLAYPDALVRIAQLRAEEGPPTRGSSDGHLAVRVRRLIERASPPGESAVSPWMAVGLFNIAGVAILWTIQTGGATASVRSLQTVVSWPVGWTPLVMGTVLGLLLGIRHACDPDHLLALSTLLSGERSAVRATGLGVSWGLGHTLSLLLVGAALAVAHVGLPAGLSGISDFGVSLMLIGLGGRAIHAAWRQGIDGPNRVHSHGLLTHRHAGALEHVHVGPWALARRPLLVGMVHGLAGSGALTALVMATLPSAAAQLTYIVVFGTGSTVGMAALSACAAWPLARFVRRPLTVAALSCFSGALSIGYGLFSGSPILWRWL
jgi:beta-lactamase regulating signal transducer with metallopeptidase domain